MTDPTGNQPDEQATGRRADRSAAPQQGRRAQLLRKRRVDAVVALAVVLPAVVTIGLAVVRDDGLPELPVYPPSRSELTAATLVCPSAVGDGDVWLTRVPQVRGGEVAVRSAAGTAESEKLPREERLEAIPGSLATVPDSAGVMAASGSGAAAPGLVAGRGEATAPAECGPPAFDEWFVGLGSASSDRSTLELVNPETGPAVAEVTLYGPGGRIEAPDDLRSITVPGNSARTIDLSTTIPKRIDFTAHLIVTRGRLSVAVRQTHDPLGRGAVTTDFLLPQAEPLTDNLMLGVPAEGRRQLFVTNPGLDELRATVKVVTSEAAFTPADTEDLVVPPGVTKNFNLDNVLPSGAMEDSLGLLVTTTQPAAVSVRSLVGEDLALFSPLQRIEEPAVAVLPEGAKRLLLGDADRVGIVHVTATDAAGKVLADERVEVGAGGAAQLELPEEAVAVTVESRSTPVAGTVLVEGSGSAPGLGVIRLREAAVYAQVPVVVPQ